MAIPYTTYANALQVVSVTIPDGETESSIIDCGHINLSGASDFLRLRTPEGFPISQISYQVAEADINDQPGSFCPHFVTDGIDTLELSTPINNTSLETTEQSIALFPAWFVAVRFLKLVCSVPVTGDTDIQLIFQPVIQGNA